jgi:hypothetical protein
LDCHSLCSFPLFSWQLLLGLLELAGEVRALLLTLPGDQLIVVPGTPDVVVHNLCTLQLLFRVRDISQYIYVDEDDVDSATTQIR